jgi:hypothetical protein
MEVVLRDDAPVRVCVCLCESPLSLLLNGSVNTFPQQQIHAAVEELFDASLSTGSVSYQRRAGD